MLTPFYHGLIRKYHIAFGSLFKQLTLLRYDSAGSEAQRFVVPIEYSARELWLTRLRQDPDLTQPNSIVLPRLAFEMTGLRYDAQRKLNALNARLRPVSYTSNLMQRYFAAVPYNLSFNLYAVTRNIEDANQIVEQIIPYFAPDYTFLVKLIPSVGIMDRMRIVLDSGGPQWSDSYDTVGTDSTREIILTFPFTVQANFYGPIAPVPSSIIRKVIVDLYEAPELDTLTAPAYAITDAFERLIAEDGTSRLLLTDATILDLARKTRIEVVPDPLDAQPLKPVDTTTTITDFEDGKRVNVYTGEDEDIVS